MLGTRARLLAVGAAVFGALALMTSGASLASASSRVGGNSDQVGSLKIQIYSQMCDGNGPNLHTRLAVRNVGSSPQSLMVHDTLANAVYDPPGAIAPGKGQLVHLTSPNNTPSHTLTVASGGQVKTMTIPKSPCTTTTTSSSTTSTTKPHGTTTTTGSSTSSTTSVTVAPGGGGNGGPGDPGGNTVVSPGVVTAAKVTTPAAVKATTAASKLPFTGSDIRGFAIIGNILVLLGFGLLLLSHRSPRVAAFFQRLRPGSAPS
jgi:hypothetical protein